MLGSDSMVVAMFIRAGLFRKDPISIPEKKDYALGLLKQLSGDIKICATLPY